jgi:signal transduction histidine kinase
MLRRMLGSKIGLRTLGAMLAVSVLPLILLGYCALRQVEAINSRLIVDSERALLAEIEAQPQAVGASRNLLPEGSSSVQANSAGIQERMARLWWQLFIGAVALTALVLVVAVALSHRITRPVHELTAGVTAIARGNLETQVPVWGDDEIGQLARAFNQMSQRVSEDIAHLQELDRAKSSFISAAAHDLKSPLSSLVSFSEVLLEYADEDPESRREFLGIIYAESSRLARMIDDLLELSRLDSGREKWQIEKLSLAEVIEEALKAAEDFTNERAIEARLSQATDDDEMAAAELVIERALGIKLRVEEGLPPVQADREALVKAIANLVSNAANSSQSEREIEVRGWQEGNAVRLDVVDHGLDIAAEDQEKVFERFARVGGHAAKKLTSTGLELAISREIVERLGGRIWVESEPGKGSTFSFTLPPVGDHSHWSHG